MISNLFYFTTGIMIAQEYPQHIPNIKSTITHLINNANNPQFSSINYLISIFNNPKK
jgi:hypothetical protein